MEVIDTNAFAATERKSVRIRAPVSSTFLAHRTRITIVSFRRPSSIYAVRNAGTIHLELVQSNLSINFANAGRYYVSNFECYVAIAGVTQATRAASAQSDIGTARRASSAKTLPTNVQCG